MSKSRLKNSCVVIVLFGLVFGFWNCQKKEANIQAETVISQSDTLTDYTLIYADSLTTHSAYKKAIEVLDTAKANALEQKNGKKQLFMV
ncbi:MAG: hypothetical protein HC803_10150 [Saprospiraceae bacterium]|nr:hypothetical protein [Saprospiraceae bacterium]